MDIVVLQEQLVLNALNNNYTDQSYTNDLCEKISNYFPGGAPCMPIV